MKRLLREIRLRWRTGCLFGHRWMHSTIGGKHFCKRSHCEAFEEPKPPDMLAQLLDEVRAIRKVLEESRPGRFGSDGVESRAGTGDQPGKQS